MRDDPRKDTPVPGTDPAPQDGTRRTATGEGEKGARAAVGARNGRRARHIDCSPGAERERPPGDGHGRHR